MVLFNWRRGLDGGEGALMEEGGGVTDEREVFKESWGLRSLNFKNIFFKI